MKMVLSKYQRYAALAAAAAIVVVQVIQFDDNGIEGYGWILSFAVAALLAIVGIGPIVGSLGSLPKAVPTPTAPPLNMSEIEEKRQQWKDSAEVLAVEVVERAKGISESAIAARNDLVAGAKFVKDDGTAHGLNSALDSFVRDRSLMFTLGLVATRRADGNSLYITTIEYKETEKLVFKAIVKEAIASQVAMGSAPNKETLLPHILDELQTIRKCVMWCATAQKDGNPDVARPLIEWLEKHGIFPPNDTLIKNALSTK